MEQLQGELAQLQGELAILNAKYLESEGIEDEESLKARESLVQRCKEKNRELQSMAIKQQNSQEEGGEGDAMDSEEHLEEAAEKGDGQKLNFIQTLNQIRSNQSGIIGSKTSPSMYDAMQNKQLSDAEKGLRYAKSFNAWSSYRKLWQVVYI